MAKTITFIRQKNNRVLRPVPRPVSLYRRRKRHFRLNPSVGLATLLVPMTKLFSIALVGLISLVLAPPLHSQTNDLRDTFAKAYALYSNGSPGPSERALSENYRWQVPFGGLQSLLFGDDCFQRVQVGGVAPAI